VVDLTSFFLVVFIVSLGLTLITFALGAGGLHIPGLHHGVPHVHLHAHAAHVPRAGHDLHADSAHAGHANGTAESISPFNMATILAFLTWFGGAGYVLTEYFSILTALAVALAAALGLAGAALVFLFLTRVLLPGQTPYLASEDFEMNGTIGRLSVGIREGGTGEMVYSKAGTRRVASARSEDGRPIARSTEVVAVRAEGAVVYVQTFEEFMQGEGKVSPQAP
jgi:membrane protein implicated in regulation of membrane protease activity